LYWRIVIDCQCKILQRQCTFYFLFKYLYSRRNILKKKGVLLELKIRRWIWKSFFSNQKDLFTRSSAKILGSLLPIRLHLLCTMCIKLGNTCLEFLVFIIWTHVCLQVCLYYCLSISLSHTHTLCFLLFTLCLHAETQWEERWKWEKILREQDSRVWRLIHVCHLET
jgi:hypothetical protein